MVGGNDLKLSSSSFSKKHSSQKLVFNYILIILVIATLVVSIFTLANVYQLKKALVPKTIDVQDFLKKLTSHAEMKNHVGITPLNIIQINSNNLVNLQSQINGLDMSYIGNFIVQYADGIVIYDYNNDKIRGAVNLQQSQVQLPTDFFEKLNKHYELQGLQAEQPVGGQLDKDSLSTLKQQLPDIYSDAKVGDFLLRYKTRLIIYDYYQDKIVNVVNLK